jgi:hypothetical protein
MSENARTFTIAGTSVFRGSKTYRFATGNIKVRVNVLGRHGEHTEIDLCELPEPMSKGDAIAWLKAQGIEATLPVTGRAGALTDEQRAEIARVAAEAAAELERQAAEIAAADAEYLASLAV